MVRNSEQHQRLEPSLPIPTLPWLGSSALHLFGIVVILAVLIAEPFFLRLWKSSVGSSQFQTDSQTAWLASVLCLIGFLAIVGHAITSRWDGVLIDERNRISLARFQAVSWTIVLLAAIHTAVAVNISLKKEDPSIKVESNLLILMGIKLGVLAGSKILVDRKMTRPTTFLTSEGLFRGRDAVENFIFYRDNLAVQQGLRPDSIQPQGQGFFKRSVEDARWSDLFQGEDMGNAGNVALSRVQQFLFTIITLMAYGATLFELFGNINEQNGILGLPALSANTLFLIGLSDTAYLGGKAIDRPMYMIPESWRINSTRASSDDPPA